MALSYRFGTHNLLQISVVDGDEELANEGEEYDEYNHGSKGHLTGISEVIAFLCVLHNVRFRNAPLTLNNAKS